MAVHRVSISDVAQLGLGLTATAEGIRVAQSSDASVQVGEVVVELAGAPVPPHMSLRDFQRAVARAAKGRTYKMPMTRSNPSENSDNWPRCCRPSFPSTSFRSLRSNAAPCSGMLDSGPARRLGEAARGALGPGLQTWRRIRLCEHLRSTPDKKESDAS